MRGIVLDTHALFWLAVAPARLVPEAFARIGEEQAAGAVFYSPISGWEVALASMKPAHKNPLDIGPLTPEEWLRSAVRSTDVKAVAIGRQIAFEAAAVAKETGHGDPADCFLIATARVKRIALVTRDATIRALARGRPGYLDIVVC